MNIIWTSKQHSRPSCQYSLFFLVSTAISNTETSTQQPQTSPVVQSSPGITTPRPPTPTKSKTATDNKQIKVILGDSLNDGDKNEDSNRKQTVLNIDQYLLSLSTTITPTTEHPSAGFDVGDHTHDEIASDLDDKNNENNTGHFALLPLPPALVKLNDSVGRAANNDGDLEGIPEVLDNESTKQSTGGTAGENNQNTENANGPPTAKHKISSFDEFMKKYYPEDGENKAVKTTPRSLVVGKEKESASYVDSFKPTAIPTRRYVFKNSI